MKVKRTWPKPISIAGHHFRTKSEAKAFIAELRDRHHDGTLIPEPDNSFLAELLRIHPESNDKIGCGIKHFTVTTDTIFRSTRHFVLHRTDGTSTDFSFHSCLDGRNDRRDRLEALRRSIESSILRFRDARFAAGEVTCPFSGSVLTSHSCHIDHKPPTTFLVLAYGWLEASGLTLDQIAITPPADNQTVTRMTDEMQRETWIDYHDRNACLRATSPRGNLSDAKQQAKIIKC